MPGLECVPAEEAVRQIRPASVAKHLIAAVSSQRVVIHILTPACSSLSILLMEAVKRQMIVVTHLQLFPSDYKNEVCEI